MSEQPHHQLEKLARKHNLSLINRRYGGEGHSWLEREKAPEGFELKLAEPFQLFTSTVDGKRLTVSHSPAGRYLPDDLWERQRRTEEWIAERFENDAREVREWKASVELEMERLQNTLDEKLGGARAVMNAWIFLVLESLPEADASERSALEGYERDMMRLRSQYRQEWASLVEKKTFSADEYPKMYVLNSLSEKYSARQMLRFESIIFWNQLGKALTAKGLRGEFSKLSAFFDVEPLIRETALDGLLHYRRKIDEQMEALFPLELDRIACEVRHTIIVRRGIVVKRGASYEKNWTEEEWAAAAEAAFSGAPKRREDCQRVVDGFNEACEAGRPMSAMGHLWREVEPEAQKVEKAVRDAFGKAGISAGDGYEEADPASLVTALQILLSHYEAER